LLALARQAAPTTEVHATEMPTAGAPAGAPAAGSHAAGPPAAGQPASSTTASAASAERVTGTPTTAVLAEKTTPVEHTHDVLQDPVAAAVDTANPLPVVSAPPAT